MRLIFAFNLNCFVDGGCIWVFVFSSQQDTVTRIRGLVCVLLILILFTTIVPLTRGDSVQDTNANIADAYARTMFDPNYYLDRQAQSLSAFTNDFIRGLFDPLSWLAKALGINTYGDAATAVKAFLTIGSVIRMADYSTLFFTYPFTSSPFEDWDIKSKFAGLAETLRSGSNLPDIQYTIGRLQALKSRVDACPDAQLMSSMFGGAAAAKNSAKAGVDSAISFLQAVAKYRAAFSVKITQLWTDRQSYRVGDSISVTISYMCSVGNVHLRVIINIVDPRGNAVYDSHVVNEDREVWIGSGQSGTSSFRWTIPSGAVKGTYRITASLRDWSNWDTIYDYRWGDSLGPTIQIS